MVVYIDEKIYFYYRENYLSEAFAEVLKHQNLNLYFLGLIKEIDVQDAYALDSFVVAESILSGVEFTYFGPVLAKKGLVNRMLGNNKNKVIWIVNYTDGIDESIKRRFTMSCQFNAMSKWRKC